MRAPVFPSTNTTALSELFAQMQARRWELAQSSAAWRKASLRRLKQTIQARQQDICNAVFADLGRPPFEVMTNEIHPVLEEINLAISQIERWMQPKWVGSGWAALGTWSHVQHQARGVVLVLSPWNYPFSLSLVPLVSAVAAGNAVVVRPSEKSPHTSQLIAQILSESFEPNHACAVLGEIEVAQALLELPFNHFFFTGSAQVGRIVMQKAAQHLATVTLELGGQSPAVLDESSHLQNAAQSIVWGKFMNAGQICIAPNHIWVPQNREQALLQALKNAMQRYFPNPAQNPDYARMQSPQSVERLQRWVQESLAQGAKLEWGGDADPAQRFMAPTLLSGVTPQMPVMQEELFGPVLPVLAYNHPAEVLNHLQSHQPLALYLFSHNHSRLQQLLKQTTSGGVGINNTILHVGNIQLPFGGVGSSGQGNYRGWHGFRTFSHERSVLHQGPLLLTKLLHPPYSGWRRKLMEWVFKRMD